MHEVTLPQEIRDRIRHRRGRFHLFDRIDPARTALVVIDMQRAFLDPGAAMEVPRARDIVLGVNRLAAAARAAGVPVVWVRMTAWRAGAKTSYPAFYRDIATGPFGDRLLDALRDGAEGHGVADALDVRPGDLQVNKTRFSAFFPGSSDIDAKLRARGVDTVIFAGTLTNRCCETSAMDAMNLGYRVIFAEDATAAVTDAEHLAALVNVATAIGDLRTTDQIVALLEGRTPGDDEALTPPGPAA